MSWWASLRKPAPPACPPQDAGGGFAPPRQAGPKPRHLVVLCHGAAADARQLRGLENVLRRALPSAEFLRPNAPLLAEQYWIVRQLNRAIGRRCWFSLKDGRQQEGVRRAAAALDERIDLELHRLGLSGKDLVLSGFSQGGMMALFCGLRRPDPPLAIICIAGAVLDERSLPAAFHGRPTVLLAHGEADPVVPVDRSREGEGLLRRLGLDVAAFYEPEIGHAVSPAMISCAGRLLSHLMDRDNPPELAAAGAPALAEPACAGLETQGAGLAEVGAAVAGVRRAAGLRASRVG
jgi:phospholipase/carboxylesterase